MKLYTDKFSGWHEGECYFTVEADDGCCQVKLHNAYFDPQLWQELSQEILVAINYMHRQQQELDVA